MLHSTLTFFKQFVSTISIGKPLETIYESEEELCSLRDVQTRVDPPFTNDQYISNRGLITDSDDSRQSD